MFLSLFILNTRWKGWQKIPPGSDETVTTVPSMLISIAAARDVVISCLSFLSSFVYFFLGQFAAVAPHFCPNLK